MTHPAHSIFEGITDTVPHIQRVDYLVKIHLPLLQQYQFIRYNDFNSLNIPQLISADTELFCDTLEYVPNEILNDDFHDAYYYRPILPELFFCSYSNQSEMTKTRR